MKPSVRHIDVGRERRVTLVEYRAILPFRAFSERYHDEAVEEACRACDNHGKNWSCPPLAPDMLERLSEACGTIEIVCYRASLEEHADALRGHATIERFKRSVLHATRSTMVDLLLQAERSHPGSITFFPGSCGSCGIENCARAGGLPCMRPQLVRPSLEALGYDLTALVEDLFDLSFCWASEGELPSHYLLVGALLSP